MAVNSGHGESMNLEVYPYDPETLARLLAEADAVDAAVQEAVREAVLVHKRLGNPVASWRDGEVVWIQPNDIEVEEKPRSR